MKCFIDAFKEVSGTGLEISYEKKTAASGIALIISGILLTVPGILTSTLIFAGVLSGLPAVFGFVFLIVVAISLALFTAGCVLLIKRYGKAEECREKKLKDLTYCASSMITDLEGILSQAVKDGQLDQASLDLFKAELKQRMTDIESSFSSYKKRTKPRFEVIERIEKIIREIGDWSALAKDDVGYFKDGEWNRKTENQGSTN